MSPAVSRPVGNRRGLSKGLLGLSQLSQCEDRVGARLQGQLGDAPPLAEVDALGRDLECGTRAMVGPDRPRREGRR